MGYFFKPDRFRLGLINARLGDSPDSEASEAHGNGSQGGSGAAGEGGLSGDRDNRGASSDQTNGIDYDAPATPDVAADRKAVKARILRSKIPKLSWSQALAVVANPALAAKIGINAVQAVVEAEVETDKALSKNYKERGFTDEQIDGLLSVDTDPGEAPEGPASGPGAENGLPVPGGNGEFTLTDGGDFPGGDSGAGGTLPGYQQELLTSLDGAYQTYAGSHNQIYQDFLDFEQHMDSGFEGISAKYEEGVVGLPKMGLQMPESWGGGVMDMAPKNHQNVLSAQNNDRVKNLNSFGTWKDRNLSSRYGMAKDLFGVEHGKALEEYGASLDKINIDRGLPVGGLSTMGSASQFPVDNDTSDWSKWAPIVAKYGPDVIAEIGGLFGGDGNSGLPSLPSYDLPDDIADFVGGDDFTIPETDLANFWEDDGGLDWPV